MDNFSLFPIENIAEKHPFFRKYTKTGMEGEKERILCDMKKATHNRENRR
jgi:hypothetical protein